MNLAHARALHERSGDDPRWCSTCTGEEWPCSTALALGATGRSEWTDDTTSQIIDLCEAVRYDSSHARCVLAAAHSTDHKDRHGGTWGDCTANPLCIRPANHYIAVGTACTDAEGNYLK